MNELRPAIEKDAIRAKLVELIRAASEQDRHRAVDLRGARHR
jgi:hypothetical protein